jgi:hypothetical protein
MYALCALVGSGSCGVVCEEAEEEDDEEKESVTEILFLFLLFGYVCTI